MRNQQNQWNQYPNAYSKDNSSYAYMTDDGTRVMLTAGKGGVTEDWIAQLKAAHIEEMNMLRRGRSKGEGQNKLLSLTQFEEEADDKSMALIDPNSDVEANYIAKLDAAEKREKLRKALESLTPEQRKLLIGVRLQKKTIASVAKAEGVTEGAIRDRLRKIEKRIYRNFC